MTFTLSEKSVTDAFASDVRMLEKCKEICEDLFNKKYDVEKFLEALAFALTSPKVELRVSGTKLLSTTLAKLPADYLTDVQLDFIATFYCDRLKDHHNVLPAVFDGIAAFTDMPNLPPGSITKLLTSFFQHVSCQSQMRDDREKIFSILKRMSKGHVDELKAMGPNFVYGVINAIDGERDPRNLYFLFCFMPTFVKQFPLHHLAEEMFETFACYFPIDFQPMKNDQKSISRDLLADKLADCLIASPEFSELAITFLLEKLESELVVAKLDSLELLSRCAKEFEPTSIDGHFDEIWTHLKSEIFPGGSNEEIVTAGLNALQTILQRAVGYPDINKNFQTKVLSNILPYVSNANHRLFGPSMLIAVACVSGDAVFAAEKILIAIAIRLKEDDCSVEQKLKLFSAMAEILKICALHNVFPRIDSTILELIEEALLAALKFNESAAQELVRLGLKNVEIVLKIFTGTQRDDIFDCLIQIITNEKFTIDLREIISKCGRQYPIEFSVKFVDILSNNFQKFSLQIKQNIYFNLVVLINSRQFEQKIMGLLIMHIFQSHDSQGQEVALIALQNFLESNIETELVRRLWIYYDILEKVNMLVQNSAITYDSLKHISCVTSLFVRRLSIEDQQSVLDNYLPQVQTLTTSELFVMNGVLGHMHENVSMGPHFEWVFESLVKLCLETNDEVVRHVCHLLLCSLVNKVEDTKENSGTIERCLHKLRNEINNNSKNAVEILAWIGKGLIVSGDEEAGGIIEDIAQLLEHPTLSGAAELAFDIISVEVPGLHLPVVKFLFKQKFFHIVLNKLWGKLKAFEENHVNAFANVLGMAPHIVLKMYLGKIGPILFKCTESDKSKPIKISLNIIKIFLQEQNDYFLSHFNHLIPQFIKLSTRPDSMEIRISSLQSLEIITKYPIHVLQPYKIDVALGLSAALDDKKRLVRNAAVKTRNAWFLLGIQNSSDG